MLLKKTRRRSRFDTRWNLLHLNCKFRVQDDLAEKMQSEVTLHDVDLAALQLLVDFAYSGQILITEDNVQVSRINWMILTADNSQKHINHVCSVRF
jgi:hypothetical protein